MSYHPHNRPQPQYQPPMSPQPMGFVGLVPQRPSSTMAVWALVLGLVGLFAGWCMLGIPCLAAVVTGHLALTDTKNDAKTGRGMAIAGLALGYVALAPAIILFFWLVLGAGAGILGGATAPVTPTP